MRVLAVGAHPDDVEGLCGGTLAKYVEQGHTIVMCHATNGDKGHHEILPHELAGIRKKEAREAAGIIKAEVIALDLSDAELTVGIPTRSKFIDMIRQAEPDVIITHSPDDYAPDHVATSQLIFDASFICTAPSIKTEHKVHKSVPPVYYMDTVAGINFMPEEYVDITGTMEIKRRMIAEHKSQLEWVREHDGVDMMEFIETTARFRGLQAGVQYAEGFCRLHAWPREITKRVLP